MKKHLLFLITFLFIVFLLIFLFPNTNRNILSSSDMKLSLFYDNSGNNNAFKELIDDIDNKKGTFSLYIKDVTHNEIYKYNEDFPVYAASLYKTPIAVAVLKSVEQNVLTLDQPVAYQPIDFSTGTGSINQYAYGTSFSVRQLLEFLLKESDNSAQNIFTRILPQKNIQDAFEISGEVNYFYHINVASSKQISEFFEKLLKGTYITGDNKQYLFELMSQTFFDDRIGKGLDENLTFAHKIGNWGDTGSWHDCGIVFSKKAKVVVCLMSENTTYDDFLDISMKVGRFLSIIMSK